ncbi:uncharacterized protein LOC115633337 [Scaptodrosophila lebanonensis]|uniref:Uncharacterized protein LOC115633337 n=1 Tax=Drosophila lebanonensis TaxID=7225 RepID=A0A6J2UE39_DROLE|nr:uncharacterized protein LOC115633337 [Scaptodrosophila lebanonensis]
MFKITPFNNRFCRLVRKSFVLGGSECNMYSIWNFCPMSRWNTLKDLLFSCGLCRSEWFPIIYWLVLSLSLLGAISSLVEFVRIYCCPNYRISMWRERKFYVLSYDVLRKGRLVGSFIMINAWIMLFYGLMRTSPIHMVPWISLNVFMLSFEFTLWIIEVMSGRLILEMNMLVSLMLPFGTLLLVKCIKGVFENAIRDNAVESLRLFS